MKDKDKYVPMGTKISPEMAEVWNAICDSLGTDTYHMLQAFIYAMIRAASPQHALTPEMQKLMTYLETDVAWQNAINLCAPMGRYTIEQMVLILSQDEKKGFGMVMIDKPYIDSPQQTECVDDIVERVVEVGVKGVYRRLRQLGIALGTESITETLITMADAQTIFELNRQDQEEMRGPANYTDYGRLYAYGKKTKSRHRSTIDTFDLQQRITFTEDDRQQAAREADPDTTDIGEEMGFRPHGEEW